MKIYIVTSGDYSSYTIEAIFTTSKDANTYCRLHDEEWRKHRVEPWEADQGKHMDAIAANIQTWVCTQQISKYQPAELRNHTFAHVYDPGDDPQLQSASFGEVVYNPYAYRDTTEHWVVLVQAKDVESARKIGAEKISQFRAEQTGIA